MTRRSSVAALLVALLVVAVSSHPAEAKSLVGSPCPKVGAVTGDGPGRTLVCEKRGGKRVWVLASNGPAAGPSCKKPPVFTRNFIDPDYVRVVEPIGGQTGTGGVIAVRSYVHPNLTLTGQRLPIYAPTELTLTGASYYKPTGSSDTYRPEYALYFVTKCGFRVNFFHIKGVVGSVATVVPTAPSGSSASQNVPSTKVKAGTQIGWYELGEKSVSFDFWVDDPSHTNSFIDPSRFAESNAQHAVCPYSFYTPALRQVWMSKLGSAGGTIVPGAACGVVSQGTRETAEGMWFISPTTKVDKVTTDGPYQSQIMFTLDAQDSVRIGGLNSTPVLTQMSVPVGSATWRAPASIRVGQTHCWSDSTQSVQVHVISAKTMSVVVGAGPCGTLPDASSGRTYYR